MTAVTSRSGTISVTTTPQGLPTALTLDPRELRKAPQMLADEVLRLCRRSALLAGVEQRAQLQESGVRNDIIDAMNLPKPDDLARAEELDDAEADAPSSWMRPL